MIDFGALFSQLISGFWWVLPLLALAVLFKSPWFKGFIGEVMVNMAARLFLDKNDYHLIKNVTIPGRACKDMRLFKQLDNSCQTLPHSSSNLRQVQFSLI